MSDFFNRAIHQLSRFSKRNGMITIQMVAIVFLFAGLLSMILQLDRLFTDEDTPYYQRLTVLEIHNQRISAMLMNEMKETKGVTGFFPFSNSYRFNWVQPELQGHYVLPSKLYFYDAESTQQQVSFFNGSDQTGVILPPDFSNELISKKRYKELFGSTDVRPSYSLLQKYQALGIESGEEISDESMTFSLQQDYIDEQATTFDLPIAGQLKNSLSLLPSDSLLLPLQSWQHLSDKGTPELRQAFIKVSNVDYIPAVLKKVKALGYQVNNQADVAAMNMKSTQDLMRDLFILLLLISTVGFINFVNLMTSVLRERKQEIALMKALGAKGRHVIGVSLTESAMLLSLSLLIGFGLVYALFILVQRFLQFGAVPSQYLESLDLDATSAQSLFNIPISVYACVTISVLFIGVLVTWLLTWNMYKSSYAALMK